MYIYDFSIESYYFIVFDYQINSYKMINGSFLEFIELKHDTKLYQMKKELIKKCKFGSTVSLLN